MPIKCAGSGHSHNTVQEVRDCQLNGKKVQYSKADLALTDHPETLEVTEGMYMIGDRIFKCQIAHHGSGRLYAKELIVEVMQVPGSETYDHYWEFVKGGISLLTRKGRRMSLEDAEKFGSLYGFCVRCGRILTKESSIAQAMGDICAGKF